MSRMTRRCSIDVVCMLLARQIKGLILYKIEDPG